MPQLYIFPTGGSIFFTFSLSLPFGHVAFCVVLFIVAEELAAAALVDECKIALAAARAATAHGPHAVFVVDECRRGLGVDQQLGLAAADGKHHLLVLSQIGCRLVPQTMMLYDFDCKDTNK